MKTLLDRSSTAFASVLLVCASVLLIPAFALAAETAPKVVTTYLTKMHCESCEKEVQAAICTKVKNTGCTTRVLNNKEKEKLHFKGDVGELTVKINPADQATLDSAMAELQKKGFTPVTANK
jgi:hypothetical protein